MEQYVKPALSILVVAVGLAVATAQNAKTKWVAPESARAKENPVPPNAEVIRGGMRLYEKNCFTCHGAEGKGDGPATQFIDATPTDISTPEVQSRMTDGEIFWKVTEGRNPMPSFEKKLSENERWKVIHYVRSLQAH